MSNFRIAFGWMIASFGMALSAAQVASAEVRLLPPTARLVGPHARQRFIVERSEGPVGMADVTSKAVFATDNPRVATVDANGFVVPAGDGLRALSIRRMCPSWSVALRSAALKIVRELTRRVGPRRRTRAGPDWGAGFWYPVTTARGASVAAVVDRGRPLP